MKTVCEHCNTAGGRSSRNEVTTCDIEALVFAMEQVVRSLYYTDNGEVNIFLPAAPGRRPKWVPLGEPIRTALIEAREIVQSLSQNEELPPWEV
jgi:hypothetical protein